MVELNCKYCNKKFKAKPSANRKFCSHECFGKWSSEHHRGSNHHRYNRIEANCDYCGSELLVTPYEYNSSKYHFCNQECYANWRKEQPKSGQYLKCENCGRTVYRSPNHLRRTNHTFCSRQCQAEWRKSNGTFSGSDNPEWRGGLIKYYGPNWKQQRKKTCERDNYACRICGATRLQNDNTALSVHHIKPFREFSYLPEENENYKQANSLENLITVCKRCHRALENGLTIEEAKERYKEPPKEVEEVDEPYECLICHRTFTTERAVYYHSNRVHDVKKKEYIIRFFGQPLCACGCGEPVNYNENRNRFPKYINGHNMRGKTHSAATKKKMSEKRKQWWANQDKR